MAAPTVQAVGAVTEGVGAVTPAPPTHQADDILLAYAEHAENATLTTATAGWAAVADSPVIQTLTADTTLDVWWKRATGAGTAGPTFDDPGNHIIAVCLIIRGCIATGNPWDVTAASTDDTADTTGSVTGDTTTVAECLILNAITTGLDLGVDAVDQFSGWADTALTGVTEQVDVARTVGNGGMIGIASGVKATAGAYGPMTVTLANAAVKAQHSMALKPPLTGGAENVDLASVTLVLAPQALSPVSGVVNLDLVPAILTLAAQALDPQEQLGTVDLVPALLTFAPQALDPVPGVVNLDLVPVVLILQPQALDPQQPPAPTYRFFPPTVEIHPLFGNPYVRRLHHPRGVSVVRQSDGSGFENRHAPLPEPDWVEGIDYFVGGHRYIRISQAVALELIASGYSPEPEL